MTNSALLVWICVGLLWGYNAIFKLQMLRLEKKMMEEQHKAHAELDHAFRKLAQEQTQQIQREAITRNKS